MAIGARRAAPHLLSGADCSRGERSWEVGEKLGPKVETRRVARFLWHSKVWPTATASVLISNIQLIEQNVAEVSCEFQQPVYFGGLDLAPATRMSRLNAETGHRVRCFKLTKELRREQLGQLEQSPDIVRPRRLDAVASEKRPTFFFVCSRFLEECGLVRRVIF